MKVHDSTKGLFMVCDVFYCREISVASYRAFEGIPMGGGDGRAWNYANDMMT